MFCFFSLNSPLVAYTETWDTTHAYTFCTGREMAIISHPELFGRTDWVHKNLSLHFAVLYGRTIDLAKGWRKLAHKGRFNMEKVSLSTLIVLSLKTFHFCLCGWESFIRFVCWNCASLNFYLHKIYNKALLCTGGQRECIAEETGEIYSNYHGFGYSEIFFLYPLLHLFDFP